MVVEVHVEATGEGVAEGGDGGAGDVGGQDDLTRLLTQTTGSSLELGLVVFVVLKSVESAMIHIVGNR